MNRQITKCPLCDSPLRITELSCVACDTKLHGTFPPPPLARLSAEHQQFVETFLRCRGVIRDVERALGVSYPTVRARLDSVVNALESILAESPLALPTNSSSERREIETTQQEIIQKESQRRAVLQQVEDGELEPEQAVEILLRL